MESVVRAGFRNIMERRRADGRLILHAELCNPAVNRSQGVVRESLARVLLQSTANLTAEGKVVPKRMTLFQESAPPINLNI